MRMATIMGASAALGMLGGCTQTSTGIPSDTSANAQAESASSSWEDEVREVVDMPQPTFAGIDWDHVSPDPSTVSGTVLTAQVTPDVSQRLFLWEEGNAPATTEPAAGSDPADFRPTITSVPVPPSMPVMGAVLLCAGGAFQVRGDNSDCYPSADQLSKLGYQTFVVDYRVQPYTMQEGALDLARAIRFVRAHASEFGLPDDSRIAVGGFSAGGILCGEELLHWKGNVSPASLDSSYEPDWLDSVSADAAACAMIYSFYGRLSVASTDANALRAGNLPPTYYCYGTRDPFYDQFEDQVELMHDIGYTVHARVMNDWQHGFGGEGGWCAQFAEFMESAFGPARASSNVVPGQFSRLTFTDSEGATVHYSLYVPENYDESRAYPLVMAAPGYNAMWFGEDSVGTNEFEPIVSDWTAAQDVIIVSPQFTDWGATSARQANELTELIMRSYAVDANRVYAAGNSAGGETMSQAVSIRPDLYAAYLHMCSQWDGTYESVANAGVAVYLAIAENDDYYGSDGTVSAYNRLVDAYRAAGATQEEVDANLVLDVRQADYFSSRGYTSAHVGGQSMLEDGAIVAWVLDHEKA